MIWLIVKKFIPWEYEEVICRVIDSSGFDPIMVGKFNREEKIEFWIDFVSKRVMLDLNKEINKLALRTYREMANCKRALTEACCSMELVEDRYTRALGDFIGNSHTLPNKLAEVQETVQKNSIGVQNVYNKFSEIEKRQLELEALLKSDRVKELIKMIPSEETVNNLYEKVNNSMIGTLNKHLMRIREELELLTDVFNS